MSEVPKYDPEVADEFEKEDGLSATDAARVAATTMDGANERPSGEIRATQTDCDHLRYKETLPEPKEVQEGRDATEGEMRKELGLGEEDDLEDYVDKWIESKEKEKGRETPN